jgi:hypothetical protein
VTNSSPYNDQIPTDPRALLLLIPLLTAIAAIDPPAAQALATALGIAVSLQQLH